MRKLILLSLAALFVNVSVQAHIASTPKEGKVNTELYKSIYSDFESYYTTQVMREEVLDIEKDALYSDLVNSFNSVYTQETLTQEYKEESYDSLYEGLLQDFDTLYTIITDAEELEDEYNDDLYNSIYNSIVKGK